jgi:beta-galactosidase
VENANNRVTVSVENGTLLGLDNGDSTDYDQYQTNSRRLWGGKLLAVARSETGCEARVTAVFDESDIPIRKIELILAGDNISRDINGVFTYNQPSSEINGDEGFVVTAQVYPPNTTYGKTDLLWRLADSKGIDSPLGVITERHGDSCTVVPRADGEISVRCAVHNGKPHADFYSALPILITGKGECLLNPYAFVAGGLYNTSNVPMTNGNERGVATLRDGISHVGFAGLDFGAFGSDTVTFGLFPMSGAPFTFGIWEGMPEEGGVCLLDACYDKGSAWNTYKDITYTLPKRLTGVTTLCLVFNQKVHIKGFIFTKPNKAYEPLTANRSDALYGDDYTVNGDYIEGIGNNVSIAYKGLNFTEGVSTVKIRWRSRREKNSIQLIFTDSNGTQKRVMIDLPGSGNYTEATFPLDISPTGLNDAEILFLPGCEIDLHWLWFNV